MMNLSQLLTTIKTDLGIYGLSLPFENSDSAIIDIIKLKTIKTFSQFAPYVMDIFLSLKDIECIQTNYQHSIYLLPDGIFGDRRLMLIRKITPRNKLLGNGYYGPEIMGNYDMYNDLMMTQASANLQSLATPSFTFRFEHPRTMHLYNMSTIADEISIQFAFEHSENLATIPNTSWETFYDLALLDVKNFLYGALKHYKEIQTAYGTVNLHIDDWETAASERKEMIERWRDVYHLDADQFFLA